MHIYANPRYRLTKSNKIHHHSRGPHYCKTTKKRSVKMRMPTLYAHPRYRLTKCNEVHHHSCCYALHACITTATGLFWELNPGSLAPEARIIPLDQTAN